jgi:HlyD family secretion protein
MPRPIPQTRPAGGELGSLRLTRFANACLLAAISMSNVTPSALEDLKIDRSARRSGGPGWWWVLLVLLLLGAGGFFWQRPNQAALVTTAPVLEETSGALRPAETILNASGYVTARRRATVSSKATGKIVEVLIEEGMAVKAGQLLARLDATNLDTTHRLAEAQLAAASAALAEIQVRLDEARREQRRVESLAQQKIASEAEQDAAEAQVKSFAARLAAQQAEVVVAERQVALYRQQLDDLEIRAPFAGIVVTKNAQPGEMISPLSAGGAFTRTGICTIVDMGSLEIEVDVNEAFINRVREGQSVTATLDAYPDWKIPGRVIAIIPTADRQKATVRVRIGFEEVDSRVLPDMGIKVAFHAEASNTSDEKPVARRLTIPQAALRSDNGRDVVFVLQDNQARRRAVQVIGRDGGRVEIASGVVAGERVIITGPEPLGDGQRVKEKQP